MQWGRDEGIAPSLPRCRCALRCARRGSVPGAAAVRTEQSVRFQPVPTPGDQNPAQLQREPTSRLSSVSIWACDPAPPPCLHQTGTCHPLHHCHRPPSPCPLPHEHLPAPPSPLPCPRSLPTASYLRGHLVCPSEAAAPAGAGGPGAACGPQRHRRPTLPHHPPLPRIRTGSRRPRPLPCVRPPAPPGLSGSPSLEPWERMAHSPP